MHIAVLSPLQRDNRATRGASPTDSDFTPAQLRSSRGHRSSFYSGPDTTSAIATIDISLSTTATTTTAAAAYPTTITATTAVAATATATISAAAISTAIAGG